MKERRYSAAGRIVRCVEIEGTIQVEVRRFSDHAIMESEAFTLSQRTTAEQRFELVSELWRFRDICKSYDHEHSRLVRLADKRGLSAGESFRQYPRLREICDRCQECGRHIDAILEKLGRGHEAIIDGWTDDLTLEEKNAMLFARKNSGKWHTYADDAAHAIRSLEKMGVVETNEFQQFRAIPVIG